MVLPLGAVVSHVRQKLHGTVVIDLDLTSDSRRWIVGGIVRKELLKTCVINFCDIYKSNYGFIRPFRWFCIMANSKDILYEYWILNDFSSWLNYFRLFFGGKY